MTTKPATDETVKQIAELLSWLEPDQRLALFAPYCQCCGSADPRCQCWNDE